MGHVFWSLTDISTLCAEVHMQEGTKKKQASNTVYGREHVRIVFNCYINFTLHLHLVNIYKDRFIYVFQYTMLFRISDYVTVH